MVLKTHFHKLKQITSLFGEGKKKKRRTEQKKKWRFSLRPQLVLNNFSTLMELQGDTGIGTKYKNISFHFM